MSAVQFENLSPEEQALAILESDITYEMRFLDRKAHIFGRMSEAQRDTWQDLVEAAKSGQGNRQELRLKLRNFIKDVQRTEDALRR